ncbi:hypothetical protein ACFE04_010336 [Oxalis oulophora]
MKDDDVSYNYGDALYWDTRYIQEVGAFDWYQRYTALQPFVHKYIPNTASRVLMLGCGNALVFSVSELKVLFFFAVTWKRWRLEENATRLTASLYALKARLGSEKESALVIDSFTNFSMLV